MKEEEHKKLVEIYKAIHKQLIVVMGSLGHHLFFLDSGYYRTTSGKKVSVACCTSCIFDTLDLGGMCDDSIDVYYEKNHLTVLGEAIYYSDPQLFTRVRNILLEEVEKSVVMQEELPND